MNLFNSTLATLMSPQKRFIANNGLGNFFGFGSAVTQSKKTITAHGSLKISAFFCGIKNISESIAILPKIIYTKEGDNRKALMDHPITKIIYRSANACMTAFSFWKAFAACVLVKGNGYARIIRNGAGRILELRLLSPEDVTVYEHDNMLFYKVPGEKKYLFADEVFHVPGFGFNGKVGVSVIQYAAENMAMSLSADAFAVEAYDDRAITYGVIETDTSGLKPEAKKTLKKIFEYNLNTGRKNRVSVLDEGMKYKPISLTPQEAMFIETKASGVGDIARWLNIPLHKLHVSGEGGYNFMVQMDLEYYKATIQPLTDSFIQEIERKLLTEKELERGYYAKFDYKKILEVDPESRSNYYRNMVLIGAMSPNEVRKEEDMNPYGEGDEYMQMANLLNQKQIEKQLNDEGK
ncbi:phage portal protein [Flagellimonas sp.]|uniref:phage portal protein n=1 Tax=Flagellimonas sp. TaxID=2058762 RepID=UPI003F49B7AC